MNSELFSGQNFHSCAESRKDALLREIQSYDMNAILNTPLEELAEYFESRYRMDAPHLKSDEIHLLDAPREVSTRERVRDRVWQDDYVNVDRNYISFTVCVPFEGDAALFDITPTSRQINMSRRMSASIHGNEIHLSYSEEAKGAEGLEKVYQGDMGLIETNSQRLAADAARYNAELPALIRDKLNARKQAAERSSSIIQSFKIPIKKREGVPTTYAIPEIRRKPRIVEPPKVRTFTPEPTLEEGEYENILTIIKDVALAMERSPATFASLSEEDIRNFFVILLNGHYEGGATGETFNGAGKTDILVRHKNANAFIAECKFWAGQKKLADAIQQLLGYVTWRDTKTAILLFNKQPDLSLVLGKAKETIQQHKNHKAEYRFKSHALQSSETILGYKFKHPSDTDKEIYLTLMAFQITNPEKESRK